MGEIDGAAYDRYVRQSEIAEKLAEDERFGKQLEAAARAMRDAPDEASRKAPREKLVRLVFGMCERTAGVANGAADGFFEKATGKPAADHAQRVTIGQAEGQVRYAADRMFEDGDAAELAGRMQRWTALQARGFANDAMYESVIAARNAGADLRYAHVPTTRNPCTFCCEIASYGFRFAKRGKKELHHGCKCRLVPGFEGDTMAGFDPREYRLLHKAKKRYDILDQKIRGYCLVDPNKAKAFESYLGFTVEDADELARRMYLSVSEVEPTFRNTDRWGERYYHDVVLDGVNGSSAKVRLAWIKDAESGKMRLTTAFVDEKGSRG